MSWWDNFAVKSYVAITYKYFGSSNVHLPIVNDLFQIHRRLTMWRDIIACANLKYNFDDSVDDYNSLIDWHWCMIYIRCGFNIFRWLTRLSARFNNTRFNNILFCMLSYCIYRESSFIFQYQKWFNMIGGSKCIKIEWFTHAVFSKFSLQMCSYFLREIRVKITSSALSICFLDYQCHGGEHSHARTFWAAGFNFGSCPKLHEQTRSWLQIFFALHP